MTEYCRRPGVSRVAQTALLRRVEVILILACCRGAVVTRGTGSQHLGVVDRDDWCPDCWVVTVLADVGGLWVLRIFAGGIGAIMAAEAIVGNICMIKGGGQPGNRCMTIVAVIATDYVSGMLAGGDDAVVA